ncbi:MULTISPECIES: LPXTG cell wall anchor domain-containing protein [Glycomyces]|uniref:LPXTG cell wall anchor domain-containing protein n=2 Tax=Glycomyces TaxID=58113 RepID=A0A9X3SXY4_9ACTN|nr:LPXTG cell wall anchor domain-containing protein [Glycomyces lechevalierae]MDA1387437.1 LPXTG cell wall anchor domain-containing protein [Glycomyces lechevalierae]MDR7338612.1 LPXTG-motif cell wall-anchored protein [Glycomyces lechevalierae]
MRLSHPLRAGRRALAVLGTAALGVGVFALPAAAQPALPTVDVVFDEPVYAGADPATGSIHLEFGDDFEPGEHEVFAQLSVYGNGWLLAGGETDDGACLMEAVPPQWVNCTAEDADGSIDFAFDYSAGIEMATDEYDWTLLVSVDDVAYDPIHGTVEVEGDDDPGENDEDWPYLHSYLEYTDVKPGDAVGVTADLLQEVPLAEDAAAVVVSASASDYIPSGQVALTADYDNCIQDDQEYVTCVITDFEDAPGTVFGFADPITYQVSGQAPGPVDVCSCSYWVRTVNADELEDLYGGVFWDEDSDDLFGFRVVDEPESEFVDRWNGDISITTTANPFDLSVADSNIKGAKGTQVTVSVPVKNLGPADAPLFFDGPGSYGLILDLPKGVELARLDSDDDTVYCFEPDEAQVVNSFPQSDLKNADYVCIFDSLGADESFDFKFTVKITDANANGKGTLEVAAMDNDGYPGVADADTKNNKADITVNGTGSGNLPKTGASLGLVIGVAALVLVAGVVLMVVTSRRRKAAAGE